MYQNWFLDYASYVILERAVPHMGDGNDMEAREAMLLGAMYGGLGLGPVNTAAVHALAYPVGGMFHKSHGLSNSVLLPTVMKFNMKAAARRYADVAIACGCQPGENDEETAMRGVDYVAALSKACGIPQTLSEIGIPQDAVGDMAKAHGAGMKGYASGKRFSLFLRASFSEATCGVCLA